MSVVEKAIKELKATPGSTQTSSLTMSIVWQDEDGQNISWPADVAGVKFQLLQKKNNAEETEYGDKVIFTSETPSRTFENIIISKSDGAGKTDNYSYTVRKPASGRYSVSVSDMTGSQASGYKLIAEIKRSPDGYKDPQNPAAGDPETVIIEIDESEPNFQLFNMRATTNKIYESSTYWEYNLNGDNGLKNFIKNIGPINAQSTDSGWALTGIYIFNYETPDYGDSNGETGTAQGGVKQRLRVTDGAVSNLLWLTKFSGSTNSTDRSLINAVYGTSTAIPAYSLTGPTGNKVTNQYPAGMYMQSGFGLSYGNRPYADKYDDYITWTQTNRGNAEANWNKIYQAFKNLKAFTSTPGRVDAEVFNEYSADEELDFGYDLNIKQSAEESTTSTLITGELVYLDDAQTYTSTTFAYSAPAWTRSNESLGTAAWLRKGYVMPYNSDYGIESSGHIEKTSVTAPARSQASGSFTGKRNLMKHKGIVDYRRVRDISFSVGNFEVTDVQINPDLVYNYVRSGSNFFVILKEDQIPYGGQLGWAIKVTLSAKGQSETKTISLIKE